jgi:hypothetical protein
MMTMRDLLAAMRAEPDGAQAPGLVPAGCRLVKFTGERGATGPLTIGQRNTMDWALDPAAHTRMIDWPLDLPVGATLDDIEAAFSVLMARHESLRTTFPADGQPIQRVMQSGELAIDLYELASPLPPDNAVPEAPALATALIGRLRAVEFDLAAGLPLRVAVALSDGVPRAAAVVYSHLVADLGAMATLGFQFTRLAADPSSRDVGPPGHQPLEQAEAEQSPRGRRRTEAALRTWETQLRTMPQCLFAVPAAEPDSNRPLAGWLWSSAAAHALPHICARTSASQQAAVLAALCALIGRRTGHPRCSLTALTHNRYERRLRDYVGSLAADTVISVDIRADSFDELVRRAASTTLKVGKGGLVDGAELKRVVREVEHDRGISYTRDCVYNDASYVDTAPPGLPGDPADATAALARSELRWIESAEPAVLMLLVLAQVEEEVVLGALTCDSGLVPRRDIESLLRGVELLLVAAAYGDVGLDRVAEITGVQPVTRGPGWLRLDSCWIDLGEVQRLVDDALPGSSARVFVEPGPAGEPELVAYLAAGDVASTPGQAHEACMALLHSARAPNGKRRTAMAPARYVICAGAPSGQADSASQAQWLSLPVLACGDGRSGQSGPVPSGRNCSTGW